ncbi:DUF1338 domain-containing protein [Blastopirellula sp. JC732]|uniref:2-oxoadipate dioxygenase/decarboxylase n=1 Tax=Blastopirellula sediminis TaxID=2894196 RepID=A0A9X1SFX9_9BACT|nr:DUF1338 domain-containing protein [Blastopirellula sediminis]MCC9609162.1 DUF1338 domain-containing protein [Blastopirellula sediminis]MCC9628061.1 DUF1338 domain-containing protein [Blastopirellula sediminis]
MSIPVLELIDILWLKFRDMNPQAGQIVDLLAERGDRLQNDHIAFRTFNDPRIGVSVLAKPFVAGGYVVGDEYQFEEKKLYAQHFEHPDPEMPKIFISELLLEKFDAPVRKTVERLIDQVDTHAINDDHPLCIAARPWRSSYEDWKLLRDVSEYAAWMAAHGFCANHFTVFVNALKSVASLQELNSLLVEKGFELNAEGGAVKGSPEVFLEQSSTLASTVNVEFTDGVHAVPGCYFEFARRYPLPNGELFSGFVAKSADKIFQSTDSRS